VGRGGSSVKGGPCSADAIVDEGEPWSMVLDKVNELVRASGPFFQRWLDSWKNRRLAHPANSEAPASATQAYCAGPLKDAS
jgi:hypothetical protein